VIVHLIELNNTPIAKQLQIEEALLRADDQNYCLINTGSTDAIVMGISGKPELLINQALYKKTPIPIIKRFSGGGTVYIDPDTYFITFIFNNQNLPHYPQEILVWTEKLLKPVFHPLNFQLSENDYTLGEHKFGGNAQYLCKNRWLHHSSLLWNYDPSKMDLLLLPSKRPAYRQNRSHKDFLCTLHPHFTKQELRERIICRLAEQFFLKEITIEEIEPILARPHRKTLMT
jgi:lipoate---protein ligase